MAEIFVFSPTSQNLATIGLAGSMLPLSCIHTEIKNGMSEIEMAHPYDNMRKWTFLKHGNILVAPVPTRTLPDIPTGDVQSYIAEKWTTNHTLGDKKAKVYKNSTGGKVIGYVKKDVVLTVTGKKNNRLRMRRGRGKNDGWIGQSNCTYVQDIIIANDPEAIERIAPAWSIKPQFFRIYSVEKNIDNVTVLAKHIFYDHERNLTTYIADNPTCNQAIAGLLTGCVNGCDLNEEVDVSTEWHSNIKDTRAGMSWKRVGLVDALLNPDTGLCKLYGGELVRDNESFRVLSEAGLNRGVRVEYGKNMTKVECTIDHTSVITRLIPVGQTKGGSDLLLTAGTYTTNHGTVVIAPGQTWIDSPHIGEYPVIKADKYELGSKAKASSSDSSAVKAARVKMIDLTMDKFANEKIDIPEIKLVVDFPTISDTAGYEQFTQLERTMLYDRLYVRHYDVEIDLLAEITEMRWNVLQERPAGVTVGSVSIQNAVKRLPAYSLPAAIPGTQIAQGTLGLTAMEENIGEAFDLTNNSTMNTSIETTVGKAVHIGSSRGGVFTKDVTETVLTAKVMLGTQDKTAEYDASRFVWTRVSTDTYGDTVWNAAHMGMKTVTITRADVLKQASFSCTVEEV